MEHTFKEKHTVFLVEREPWSYMFPKIWNKFWDFLGFVSHLNKVQFVPLQCAFHADYRSCSRQWSLEGRKVAFDAKLRTSGGQTWPVAVESSVREALFPLFMLFNTVWSTGRYAKVTITYNMTTTYGRCLNCVQMFQFNFHVPSLSK